MCTFEKVIPNVTWINLTHTHTYIYKVEFKCGVTLSNVTPFNIFNLMWI